MGAARPSAPAIAVRRLLGLVGEDMIVWISDTVYVPGHTSSQMPRTATSIT